MNIEQIIAKFGMGCSKYIFTYNISMAYGQRL